MNGNTALTNAVRVSLGVLLAVSLAACSNGNNQGQPQGANTPANLALTTSAAPAQQPLQNGADGQTPAQQAGAAQPQFAKVVAVTPVTRTTTTSKPRQVCRDEQVAVPEHYKDKNQIGGAVVGGLVGALAGHQVGGGKGKTLATIAGAAGGAYAGHEIQKHHQENNRTRMETRNVCHTVEDKTTKTTTVGYDVTYSLNGETGHVRMDHNPGVGTGLPVKDGVVVAGGTQKGNYYR